MILQVTPRMEFLMKMPRTRPIPIEMLPTYSKQITYNSLWRGNEVLWAAASKEKSSLIKKNDKYEREWFY